MMRLTLDEAIGMETTNKGFADLCLPLGYAALILIVDCGSHIGLAVLQSSKLDTML